MQTQCSASRVNMLFLCKLNAADLLWRQTNGFFLNASVSSSTIAWKALKCLVRCTVVLATTKHKDNVGRARTSLNTSMGCGPMDSVPISTILCYFLLYICIVFSQLFYILYWQENMERYTSIIKMSREIYQTICIYVHKSVDQKIWSQVDSRFRTHTTIRSEHHASILHYFEVPSHGVAASFFTAVILASCALFLSSLNPSPERN